MLLNRLQSDAYSHFYHGGKLWGITPEYHAEKMVELWESLKVKPQWLTLNELENIVFKLTGKGITK